MKSKWRHIDQDNDGFIAIVSEIVSNRVWEVIPTDQPYGDVDALFQAELGVSYTDALAKVNASKNRELVRQLAEAKPAGRRGRPIKAEQSNKVYNINLKSGTSATYLSRRLAKHDAEKGTTFLADWEGGVHKSLRAAAVAAGIVKAPDVLRAAQRLWEKMTPEDRDAFEDFISDWRQRNVKDSIDA